MKNPVHIALWELDNRSKNLKFPVPPESLPTQKGGKAETVNIVGVGERIIFGGEKLATFTLEAFFPALYDPSYVVESNGTYLAPYKSLKVLEDWCDVEKPLYLYSKEAPLGREVVITNLDYDQQRAGHIDDIWFTLEFKTYKSPTFRSVALKQTSGNGGVKAPAKKATAKNADKLPINYTVKSGDTLAKIAQIHYGRADYQKIYAANKTQLDKKNKTQGNTSKYTIYPGQKLTIPK